MAKKKIRANMTLTEETLKLADEHAELMGVNRSAFITFLIREYADNYERNQANIKRLLLMSEEKSEK